MSKWLFITSTFLDLELYQMDVKMAFLQFQERDSSLQASMGWNKPYIFGIRNLILSCSQMASTEIQPIIFFIWKRKDHFGFVCWWDAHCRKAWHKFARIKMQTQICIFYERSQNRWACSWDKNNKRQTKEVIICIPREVHWEGIGKISDDWCKAIFSASLITRKSFKSILSQRQRGNRKNDS